MPVRSILDAEVEAGVRELDRPSRGLLLSALSAGLDLGFGPLLIATIVTLADGSIHPLWQSLLTANAYSVGFIFVVLGRSELFTEHTTLAVLPVIDGRCPLRLLARHWARVYVANLVGAAVFGALAVAVGTSTGIVQSAAIEAIVHKVVAHPWWAILLSAVLAGWLMGLLSWLLRASQETISQLAIVWVVTAAIGLAHLHHCVVGTVEVVMGLVVSSHFGMWDLGHFLLWTTLGNAFGGVVFVAVLKYGHASKPSRRE